VFADLGVVMARIYARKTDPLRSNLTVPMTDATLKRLREYAEQTGRTPTATARELIERNLPGALK
jgi:alkanesulfonate monooxygenase SsuD/methylene tetrahydromethanopterin reductase-like flavin-dependent oxidoreductase (luciferase family)